MRIGIAQVNPAVGDIEGNAQLILKTAREAAQKKCDLVLFPELALTGYPPEDLILKPAFIEDNERALARISRQISGLAAVIGFIEGHAAGVCFNAAAWIEKGRISGIYRKRQLPNYGVFDEKRYFAPGKTAFVKKLKGFRVGLTICEDIWIMGNQLKSLKAQRPELVLNLSASPFHAGKLPVRHDVAVNAARYLSAPLIYCNMVGGQDELVMDGGSFVAAPQGKIPFQSPSFKESLFVVEAEKERSKSISFKSLEAAVPPLKPIEEIHAALILGIRDYINKNGFKNVAVGISGGIDSALVAALAVEVLGKDRVMGITMPSKYNLSETREDAGRLAKNLGLCFIEIPIQSIFQKYLEILAPLFARTEPNIAEENLQARVRGNLLMALSNKFGWLILTTGNKSEISTGYCTLYGDTAGGFAVLKDVLKTTVYDLARFINEKAGKSIIPESIIKRPPTAELRENQRDEDSLGRYADLDRVIVGYIEKNQSAEQIAASTKLPLDYVRRTISLIDRNEYKRRQAPPGIKITPRSFGRDHRMPITNRYRRD